MNFKEMVNLYSEEGTEHFQLSPLSSSIVGKFLSPEWRYKFFIPQIGNFNSAIGFCNWIAGAGEEARYNDRVKGHITIPYKMLLTVGKYHQLKAMVNELRKFPEDWDSLPLVRYRVHQNGVKELTPDNDWYPRNVHMLALWVRAEMDPEWDTFDANTNPYEVIDNLVNVNILRKG